MLIVVSVFALIALFLMSNESRLTEHKIRRIRAFFAAQAGLVDAIEALRRSDIPGNNQTDTFPYTINVGGYTVTVNRNPGNGTDGTDVINASVTYF